MKKSNYEKLRETLIESSHRLICAALEKCESEELIYDAIYNAVISTKLKYKKIINKDITVELCISLIKKPKKRSKKEFDSVEECINRAIDDFAVRKKPIITAVSIILLAAMIIPTLITGGVIYIQSRGFTMEGSVALGNNIKGDDTMIKNLSEISKMGVESLTKLSGYEPGPADTSTYNCITTDKGDTYLVQGYIKRFKSEAEFILYKAAEDGWHEVGRAPMTQRSFVRVETDKEGDVYVFTKYNDTIQAHRYSKDGEFGLVDELDGDKDILKYIDAFTNIYDKKYERVHFVLHVKVGDQSSSDSYNAYTDFDTDKEEFTKVVYPNGELLQFRGGRFIALDGDGGIWYYVNRNHYENGIVDKTKTIYSLIHVKDGRLIEKIDYATAMKRVPTTYSTWFVGVEGDELHQVLRISTGELERNYKIYHIIYKNGVEVSRERVITGITDDHVVLFYFLKDGELYQVNMVVNEWLVINRITGDRKIKKVAEIKMPYRCDMEAYIDTRRVNFIDDGNVINFVVQECGDTPYFWDFKTSHFGQLILDLED